MELKKIFPLVDHTLLLQTATDDEIKTICDEAVKYGTASVCIPPSFVSFAKEYLGGKIDVCTVIGFPNGYNTTEVKVFETQNAINNGANEIDMVINIGNVKDGKFDLILNEIKQIKSACGDKTLKVIIETCLLTKEEKIKLCEVVTKSGADYIKTSTGFSKSGATLEDVEIFNNYIGKDLKIKAAGGISSVEDAENFIKAGCSRLGTSRIVKIANNMNDDNSSY